MTSGNLAREFEALVCETNAIGCEVSGMKAENKFREQIGQSVAYAEDSFLLMAEKYRVIAEKFRDLGK